MVYEMLMSFESISNIIVIFIVNSNQRENPTCLYKVGLLFENCIYFIFMCPFSFVFFSGTRTLFSVTWSQSPAKERLCKKNLFLFQLFLTFTIINIKNYRVIIEWWVISNDVIFDLGLFYMMFNQLQTYLHYLRIFKGRKLIIWF